MFRISPLDHVVVLNADDVQTVKIVLAREVLDVPDVPGGESGRQFDHDPAAGQIHVQRVPGIRCPPGRGWRAFQYLRQGGWGRAERVRQQRHGERQQEAFDEISGHELAFGTSGFALRYCHE